MHRADDAIRIVDRAIDAGINRKEMAKMKKFVSTLGLGLLLGCFAACGGDLGAPPPPDAGPDGGKSADGGGSSAAGHPALDGGNKSETSLADVGVDVGVDDLPAPGDSGIGGGGLVDGGGAVDVLVGPDLAADTSLHPIVLDSGPVDAGSLVDVTSDHPVGVDGGSVDTGSLNEVGFDSSGPLDGSGLSVVVPLSGERFSPPLPNADSLPSGVWYCDMGTVHWAQGEKGTGTCPICGMDLVQKS